VEGSITTGERRAGCCCCCWSLAGLVSEGGLDLASFRASEPGAAGGGSRGTVLSVLVLVTRRNSGPLGLVVVDDGLVGVGGGSEALDAIYGWIHGGMVTDALRDGGRAGIMAVGFGPLDNRARRQDQPLRLGTSVPNRHAAQPLGSLHAQPEEILRLAVLGRPAAD
jgi:hypothetical protein